MEGKSVGQALLSVLFNTGRDLLSHSGVGRRVAGDIFRPLGADTGLVGPKVYIVLGTIFKKKNLQLPVQS